MSSLELSHKFDLRHKTCWGFKRKIQQAMRSSKQHPFSCMVYVDEFFVGEYEEGQVGRSSGSKKRLVIVALEVLDEGGVGRVYAKVINHASGKEFKPFFNSYISKDAHIVSDKWKGYLPLKKEYTSNRGHQIKGKTSPNSTFT